MDGSPAYTQTERQLAIQTPLGENAFLLEAMDGSESLSSLFSFSLRVRAMTDTIDPAQLITKAVDWQLRLDGGGWRNFQRLVANLFGRRGDEPRPALLHAAPCRPLAVVPAAPPGQPRVPEQHGPADRHADLYRARLQGFRSPAAWRRNTSRACIACNTASRTSISSRACSRKRGFSTTSSTSRAGMC